MAIIRECTDKLIMMADEGAISWEELSRNLLGWMSELEVKEFFDKHYRDDSDDESEDDDLFAMDDLTEEEEFWLNAESNGETF